MRVNAVSPGEIDTGILSPGTETIVERDIPLHRLGKPRDVADLLLFLCSNRELYFGSEIHIDGGQRVYVDREPAGLPQLDPADGNAAWLA